MPNVWPVHNPPNTLVKSSHGIQIKVSGVTIGAINNWTPAPNQRAVTQVYELNPLSSGHPIDNAIGNLSGFTLAVDRYDIWTLPFELVFGGDITVEDALGNQVNPFDSYQYLWRPDGVIELTIYRKCWFSKVGRAYQSTGDRIVHVNAELTFLRRDKVV